MKIGITKKTGAIEKLEKKQVGHLHVPGKAFNISNATIKLINMIGNFTNEPKYYESGRSYGDFLSQLLIDGKITRSIVNEKGLNEQSVELFETAKAAADESPEDFMCVLSWARDTKNGLKLRETPAVLFALASHHEGTRPLLEKYVNNIILRGDEAVSIFAAYRHLVKPKGTIVHKLQKALAIGLSNLKTYNLIKYQSDSKYPNLITVVDSIRGKHLKMDNEAGYPIEKSVYNYLKFGKVDESSAEIIKARQKFFQNKDIAQVTIKDVENAGLTWENVISHFGANRAAWEVVIPVMAEMALIRNLRNFEQANISSEAWDLVEKRVLSTQDTVQLPFRFFSAYQEVTSTRAKSTTAIALDNAVRNIPVLDGTTVILVDNSGSAVGYPVSKNSKITVSDTGNMLGAIAAKRFGHNCIVGVFGDNLKWVEFNSADSTISIKNQIDKQHVGQGTETGLWYAIEDLIARSIKVDRFILCSDLCCYTQGDVNCGRKMKYSIAGLIEQYRNKVNKKAKVYSVNLAGYGQCQIDPEQKGNYILSGWSEKIFTLIANIEGSLEESPKALPTIETIRAMYKKGQ